MLCRILDQQLYRAWWNKHGHDFIGNVDIHFKTFRETHFQQVYIKVHKHHFLPQRNHILIFTFDHVPVYSGKFMRIQAGLFGFFFTNHAIENVE